MLPNFTVTGPMSTKFDTHFNEEILWGWRCRATPGLIRTCPRDRIIEPLDAFCEFCQMAILCAAKQHGWMRTQTAEGHCYIPLALIWGLGKVWVPDTCPLGAMERQENGDRCAH